jgi:hypothetical protein
MTLPSRALELVNQVEYGARWLSPQALARMKANEAAVQPGALATRVLLAADASLHSAGDRRRAYQENYRRQKRGCIVPEWCNSSTDSVGQYWKGHLALGIA